MARITCIGTGNVGRAWAVVFARAGHTVALFDAQPDLALNVAMPRIRQTLKELAEAMPTGESADDVASRIQVHAMIADAVRDADYVQESVREDVAVKRSVFAEIADAAPHQCLLASSTSALPGSAFLSAIVHPERAFVAHPVNPPSHIPLVELCGTGATSAEALGAAQNLLSAAGMEPIIVRKEIDGFILNRLQYTMVAEAMHLIGEGYCTAEDIDRVVTSGLALRWASIGPFMTAHLNATKGFAGFVEQLGPMMKRMGQDAKTDYDWGPQQVAEIHEWLASQLPVNDIAEAQAWRDRRILVTRAMQKSDDGVGKAKKPEPETF